MKLDFIKNAFDNLQTELSQDGEAITIFNPYSKGNITIDYEFYESTDGLDSFEQYTAQFSYQHRHFSNENDVLEWIQGVTDGKILAIELFCGAKNRRGGEIYFSNVDNLKKDVCEYISASKECDNFKIRSYNGENDYDGYILNDEQRGTYIVINKI